MGIAEPRIGTSSPPLQQGRTLLGRHVVVTRPADQATYLAAAVGAAGGVAVLFPVLAIHDIGDHGPLLELSARLDQFDLAVFISPNAVNKALTVIAPQRSWPASLRIATMGKTSERELARFGFDDVIAPRLRFDSEALLELPEMLEVEGKRVVVFRGDSGRDLLGDTLKARGATVEYVTCYRRGKPDLDNAPLLQLWRDHQLDAIIITSSEGLRNLVEMLGAAGQALLNATPVFVPHARIVAEARTLGLARVVPTGPGDDGLINGLISYFSTVEHACATRPDEEVQPTVPQHGN